ncbi:Uncharacterised protein [Chromobacterium violaceum]|uniref:Uncharacterized protein n=1 Tax=Chromobacterium violaceum TaxID=536 RepID=A0A447T6X0_CHRVL|nr:Uncharacterised protein [Chromobacterium violaceum]
MYFNASANASASIPALALKPQAPAAKNKIACAPASPRRRIQDQQAAVAARRIRICIAAELDAANGASVMQNGMHIVKAGISYRF